MKYFRIIVVVIVLASILCFSTVQATAVDPGYICQAGQTTTYTFPRYCGDFADTCECVKNQKIVCCTAICYVSRTYCDGVYLNQIVVCENTGTRYDCYPNGDTCEHK